MIPEASRAGALVLVSTSRTPDGEVVLWSLTVGGDPPDPGPLLPVTRSRAKWLWVQVAADGAGGAYAAWTGPGPEGGASRVRLLRLTARGEPAWPAPADGGLEPVPGAVASVAAGNGGAAVAWSVTGPASPAVVAFRAFDGAGRPDRDAPVRLGTAANPERSPLLAAVAGGWVVGWTEREPGDRESARAAFVPARRGDPSPPLRLYGTDFCLAQPQLAVAAGRDRVVVFSSTSGCVADANVLRAISLRVGGGR
jgi:hypothetical protein